MPDAPTSVMERIRDIVSKYAWPDRPDTIQISLGGLTLGDLRALLEVAEKLALLRVRMDAALAANVDHESAAFAEFFDLENRVWSTLSRVTRAGG